MPFLLFLSGASGSGKTAVLPHLQQFIPNQRIELLHFDSIGIPTRDEMISQAGSLERWQEEATHSWIQRISCEYKDASFVVLEGQANPNFVRSACARYAISEYEILLLDCDWDIRAARLIESRREAELATPEMKNWSDYLRNQAQQQKITVIDTTTKTSKEVAKEIIELLPHRLNE